MRFDKNGKVITLEEDIAEIWRQHGWEVIEEQASKSNDDTHTWIIRAKVTKGKPK